MVDAVILCAGKSTRMGLDKLKIEFDDGVAFLHSVAAFSCREDIDRIFIVGKDKSYFSDYVDFSGDRIRFVEGGATRFDSVKNALALSAGDTVLIHDGARPFVSQELITRVLDGARSFGACVPALPVTDSVKLTKNGEIIGSADRNSFVTVQTPQGFCGEKIRTAYLSATPFGTDDSEVYAALYGGVRTTEGEESNIKLTSPKDLLPINKVVGIGADVHRLEEGLPLVLGGVVVPHSKGLVAHSDGDAVLHAVMDALLSCSGNRDIGVLFPDADDAYRGISSKTLTREVVARIKADGYLPDSVSAVIIAEKPKLAPYISMMKEEIASLLEIPESRVNLSATTSEGLGITGEEKGICVLAEAICKKK